MGSLPPAEVRRSLLLRLLRLLLLLLLYLRAATPRLAALWYLWLWRRLVVVMVGVGRTLGSDAGGGRLWVVEHAVSVSGLRHRRGRRAGRMRRCCLRRLRLHHVRTGSVRLVHHLSTTHIRRVRRP